MAVLLLILAAIGHAVLWLGLVNRAHGLGFHKRWVDLLTGLCCVALVVVPAGVAIALAPRWIAWEPLRAYRVAQFADVLAWSYVIGAAMLAVVAAVERWRWRRHPERQAALLANHTAHIDVAERARGPLTAPGISTWLSRLPGNEVLTLRVQEKQLMIPRLSPRHEGLRVVHFSDLHMSGRIAREYFEHMVEEVNRAEPDLIAITGDLIERPQCLDWIPDTFGRLRAPGGVYYVLGNHDRDVEFGRLTSALADAGLIHLGGRWREITVRDTPIILAGNELPWFKPAADFSGCPPHDERGLPLRILLSHSPDQLGWARARDVDLVLAGHLHGGQVCLPVLGPIVAPSLRGVRYASGTFRAGDTVLHVTRGAGSLTPIRWNCPPEVAVLTLRGGGERGTV